MENIVREYLDKFRKDHERQRRYACLLGVLALLVCLAVFWRLKLVGTAMTNEATCGLQEHTHTEECYSNVLVCGIATGETAEGAEHVHTADCFERQLVCTIPEHTHTADCYSNAEADTETEADWTASFPQEALTGDWAQDTVLIAASQVGYTESTQNWQLNEDGTHRGYNRYGAWYGNPYGDWNGMFAAFCLHYAGVDDAYLTTANAAGVNAWAVALYQAGELQGPGHEAVPGDVVFLGSDDKIESCAIVTDVYNVDGVPTLSVLAGDVDNAVAELTIPTDSESILGYAATADAYAAYAADHPAEDAVTEEEPEETPEDAEQTDDVTYEGDEDTMDAVEPAEQTSYVTADGLDLSGKYGTGKNNTYIQNVEGGTAEYGDGKFKTTFDMQLRMPKAELEKTMQDDGFAHAYYVMPDKIKLTSDLVNGEWRQSSTEGVEYRFVEVDGQKRIEIRLAKDYMEKAGTYVDVESLMFTAEAGITDQTDKGDLIFRFTDEKDCTIPYERVTYPEDDDTLNYDINVKKEGTFDQDTNTLTYKATVSTTKGTPDPITVTDNLTNLGDNITVESCTITKITKSENGKETVLSQKDYKVEEGAQNKKFTLTLDGLAAPANGAEENTYVIEYQYKLNVKGTVSQKAKNKLEATATDRKETVTDKTEIETSVTKSAVEKTGEADPTNPVIHWTITVNGSYANIAGKELTDSMFGEITKDALKFTITDADGNPPENPEGTYKISTDADGKVTGITFIGTGDEGEEKNNYKYVITYDTKYTPGVYNHITNKADFDGSSSSSTVKGEVGAGGNVTKKAGLTGTVYVDLKNKQIIPWTVEIEPPATTNTLPKGTPIDEVMTQYGSNHYMTVEQAKEFLAVLDASPLAGKYTDVKFYQADDSKKVYTSLADVPSGKNIGRIRFTLSDDVVLKPGEKVVLNYNTTLDSSGQNLGDKKTVSNYIEVGDLMGRDTITTVNVGVHKGLVSNVGSFTEETKDQTFLWYVKVGTSDAEDVTDTYEITDYLPGNVELVQVGVGMTQQADTYQKGGTQRFKPDGSGKLTKVDGYPLNSTSSYKYITALDVQEATISDKNVVYLKIQKTAAYKGQTHFFVLFEVKLKEGVWDSQPEDATTTLPLKNRAEVKCNGKDAGWWESTLNATIDKTTPKPPEPEKVQEVKKYGDWSGFNAGRTDGDLHYSLDINPEGKQLLTTENGRLEFTDWLGNQSTDFATCDLLLETVKLYHAKTDADGNVLRDENGRLIPDTEVEQALWTLDSYTVDGGTHTLKLTLPDKMPMVLQYTYHVQYTGDITATDKNINISNTASLAGYQSNRDQEWISWESSNSALKMANTYVFTKVDEKSYSRGLRGAVFQLYKWDADENAFVEVLAADGKEKTYTTDDNGQFVIKRMSDDFTYDYNTAYMVKEIAAPGVYRLPDDATPYYFYFSSGSAEKCMPSDFPNGNDYKNAIDLTTRNGSMVVTNAQVDTNLVVKKVWADNTPADQKQAVDVAVKSITVPLDAWNAYYNQGYTLSVSGNNLSKTVRYPTGQQVTIRYLQGRGWTGNTFPDSITVKVNDVPCIASCVEQYPDAADGYPYGYAAYEITVTMDRNVKCELDMNGTGAIWTNQAEFVLPGGAPTDDEWSANAGSTLAALKETYADTIQTVAEISVAEGADRTLYALPLVAANATDTTPEMRYIYYVEEKVPNGFKSDVSMTFTHTDDEMEPFDSYTFTVTNTPTTAYELPETGGRGTVPYMAGGLALMACSLLCGYILKRKREGRQDD